MINCRRITQSKDRKLNAEIKQPKTDSRGLCQRPEFLGELLHSNNGYFEKENHLRCHHAHHSYLLARDFQRAYVLMVLSAHLSNPSDENINVTKINSLSSFNLKFEKKIMEGKGLINLTLELGAGRGVLLGQEIIDE